MENIVICAAQSVTRAGLAAMASTATAQVVASFDSLSALNECLQYENHDVPIVDVVIIEFSFLTTENGEAVLEIMEAFSSDAAIAIVLLVEEVNAEISTKQALMSLLASGIVSVLPLSVSASALRSAIATITYGFTLLHPDFTENLFTPIQTSLSPEPFSEDPLTPREVEVLNELASGLTNRAIAQSLNISEHTVKFHISAILSKLDVSSRTEAVAVGIRSGFVML